MSVAPAAGQTWRDPSYQRMVIVAVDDRFVRVKRADSPKKVLANPAGGYAVSRRELAGEWKWES